MEQILNKLSEIEATANAIMQDAARQKKALSDQLSRLDAYYEANHESLCSELFQKITGINET